MSATFRPIKPWKKKKKITSYSTETWKIRQGGSFRLIAPSSCPILRPTFLFFFLFWGRWAALLSSHCPPARQNEVLVSPNASETVIMTRPACCYIRVWMTLTYYTDYSLTDACVGKGLEVSINLNHGDTKRKIDFLNLIGQQGLSR